MSMGVVDDEYSDDAWWDMVYHNQEEEDLPAEATTAQSMTGNNSTEMFIEYGRRPIVSHWGGSDKCSSGCLVILLCIVLAACLACCCVIACLIRKFRLRKRAHAKSPVTVSCQNAKQVEAGLNTQLAIDIPTKLVLRPPAYSELGCDTGAPPQYTDQAPPQYNDGSAPY